MASFASISAVGKSVERLLTAAFANEPPLTTGGPVKAILVRTEDFEPANLAMAIPAPALSLFMYRVDFNKAVRAGWSAIAHQDGRVHLPVDVHFLITPWSSDAESELKILGRAMQVLETTPILAGPLLLNTGEFAPHETVQVLLEEISTEAVMRMFDSLPTNYKLSVPYVARVVRIDGKVANPSPPVLTTVSGSVPSLP